MCADNRVGLVRPAHRRRDGILEAHIRGPQLTSRRIFPGLNLLGQVGRPAEPGVVRLPADAAEQLLGDARVPDVVQVQLAALPLHVDAVAALRDVLDVQRLVDVADEVDDELGRLRPAPRPQLRVQHLRRVVLDRAHDAAVLLAVALEVDAAVRRRRVLGVDEVEVFRETSPFRVPDAVGPSRDAGEVVLGLVLQEALEERCRVVFDEVCRDVGNRDVPQA